MVENDRYDGKAADKWVLPKHREQDVLRNAQIAMDHPDAITHPHLDEMLMRFEPKRRTGWRLMVRRIGAVRLHYLLLRNAGRGFGRWESLKLAIRLAWSDRPMGISLIPGARYLFVFGKTKPPAKYYIDPTEDE